MKVRILHLISSLKRGGAETVLALLLEHWNEPDHVHIVLYFHDGPLRERIEKCGIQTICIKGLICIYDPLFVIRLIFHIKKFNPTLIYSSLWAANFLGRSIAFFLKIPIICSVHALASHEGKVRNILDRWLSFKPHMYVAVSRSIQKSLITNLNFPAHKIKYIANGISPDVIKKVNILTREHFFNSGQENIFIIGAVGRLVPVKNYNILLEAFALLCMEYSFVRLIIVGEGPQEKYLKEQACHLNIQTKVIFIIGQPALAYYSLFDCFIQPSQYEGLSLALLEALIYEIPVIVSTYQGEHEIIKHGYNGFIVEEPTAEYIKKVFISFFKNQPHTLKQMSSIGKQMVINSFSTLDMVKHYKSFL